ncbi:alkene reductase [Phanerochaete sordida]|uniref:Alkene reductase n=1 Tax=Phanerochaete sordida TaxID=48140 RepID=A0A9P3GK12_9APHY|nr:alkene reductase [Phanerochaete sordida]
MAQPKLFTPIQVGRLTLAHRVVMPPLERLRSTADHIPNALMAEYYAQRASTPGTLLIAEATMPAPRAAGYRHGAGVWSDEQVQGWRVVTDGVHARGSYIFQQLWAPGRLAQLDVLEEQGLPYVSASDVKLSDCPKAPRPLTIEEIKEYVKSFGDGARNSMRAGFDGVELHAANGYLVDQFLQDVTNHRTDEYGGSIENRCRFALEIIQAMVDAVGDEAKVGFRCSPWGSFGEVGMEDPKPTFAYLVTQLRDRFPSLAYIHVIEPRINGDGLDRSVDKGESNDFLREIWKPRPFISAGGYTERELALEAAERTGDLIAAGRLFISNPDLPLRWQLNVPAKKGDRSAYYTYESPKGYVDYPFMNGEVQPERFKPVSA